MDENLEKVMSMARKLKALAERGEGGEKTSAESKYKDYLKQHNLTDSDINPEMNKRVIEALDGDYKDVLLNVILSVNPYTKHSDNTTNIECYLDNEDYTEVLKKYEYFSKLLRIEKELLITSFIKKHSPAFEPDEKSKKKWRERRVENQAFTTKNEEAKIIEKEYNRMQADKALNVDVTLRVINSDDRLVVTAFNKDRISLMQDILLDSEYVRNHTRIDSKSSDKSNWGDWLKSVKKEEK